MTPVRLLLLALLATACGPRTAPPPPEPPAHAVPVELAWPDAGAPSGTPITP